MKEHVWLPIAKRLPTGCTTRIKCCGKDSSRVIGCSPTHWWTKCFRCHDSKRIPKTYLSLKEIRERDRYTQNFMHSSVTLPHDFTESIPIQGRLWLYSASIYGELLEQYRIGWSDSLQRVVIPVQSNTGLEAVVCRAVNKGHKPKYLTKQKTSGTLFLSKSHCMVVDSFAEGTLVVVEDILSAMRCGRVCPTLSILGTWINTAFLNHVLKYKYNKIVCWYDNDPAGHNASISSYKKLTLQGIDVRTVRTEKDPKCYSNKEITSILKGVLYG